MKKILLIIFALVLASAAFAQTELKNLTPSYWIAGTVADTTDATVGTRNVYFYLDQAALDAGDYAAGLTASNLFMINGLSIYPGIMTVGTTYNVATEQDDNGYGANGTVVVSGFGWDEVKGMVLRLGGGIMKPGVRPDMLPKFDDIRFGNRKWQPAIYNKDFPYIVSAQPKVSATVVSDTGINTNKIAMIMNEGTPLVKSYAISASNLVKAEGPSAAPTKITFEYDFAKAGETIPTGDQQFSFKASNAYGTTVEVVSVSVAAGSSLIGTPVTFPSPVHLRTDSQVIFQYTLSNDINVDLYLFDISGRVAKKMSFNSGGEGGSAGVNKPAWDLISDQGTLIGSGIYLFNLVNRDNGKLLGKGKLTAVP